MIRGFTFERALAWPFTAPHAASFPWIFGAAFALAFLFLFAVVGSLSAGDISGWIRTVEAAGESNDTEADLAAFQDGIAMLLPWALLSGIASWALWAMFETASQRRFIWGEGFTLGFGADELRMMVVGLLWSLLGFVIIGVPILLIMGPTFFALITDPVAFESEADANAVGLQVLGVFFVMLVLFPVYVFFATRLAPCFGLTVKEHRIRFFDAWNVSRGRFWPILGAYVILAFAGGIIGQVFAGIAQAIIMPATVQSFENVATSEEVRALIFSPGFYLPMGIYFFITLFLQGVLQHVVGGPAALAVRHDPRGGVEAEAQIGAFD